ncbi:L,D-transpeptidase [Aliarcobacter butzleri]|uniref:L,D-transpeptidase n=1 Tax=Aliarcobacter butzleri TaxID=28197 RepID=UPI001917CC83|nr:L,D-transpeptidase [Aliarcobacter butzleri]
MLRKIILILPIFYTLFVYAQDEKYTISVCTTSNLENALACKKNIFEKTIGDVFIVKENNKFHTYLNIYEDKEIAKVTIRNASPYVKQQNPFIKQIDEKIVKQINKRKLYIDINEQPTQNIKSEIKEIIVKQEETKKEPKKIENQESLIPLVSAIPDNLELVGFYPYIENKPAEKKEIKQTQEVSNQNNIDDSEEEDDDSLDENDKEELKQISMDEFDKANKIEHPIKSYEKKVIKPINNDLTNVQNFQQMIIEVDSATNIMKVKAKINNHLKDIQTYIVSTGKDSVKKPFGVGKISQVSLDPVWYPTEDTLKSFEKRGIILPKVVPSGHKYNYMGAAKINLTHIVDGKSTYRIHGTLNEKTIGTKESAGCIRMRNGDVLQLANLIDEFANYKGLDSIKVVLY